MKIVITQPTYLSWIGYYGLIDLADIFVFYDDVQFERRSWQCRNKIINLNSKEGYQWLTVPIIHNGQQEKINEVNINYGQNWQENHWKAICHSYCKTPYFKKYAEQIECIYNEKFNTISELNIYIIMQISKLIGVSCNNFILSSDIKNVQGSKTDRLLSVIDNLNLDSEKQYISSVKAKAYLEIEKFKNQGIDVYWFDYIHPQYNQMNTSFIPYLSILDLLFNEGDNSLDIIRKNLIDSLHLQ